MCWRHKTPVIFRATPQWFISMEHARLREHTLRDIKGVQWTPAWGEQRITGMIESRPDWCISRQRTWGVPIPLFVHKASGELHPRTPGADRGGGGARGAGAASTPGSRSRPHELLGAEAEHYDKVTDVMDVWVDSGAVVRMRRHRAPRDRRARWSCTWKAPTSIAAGSTPRC